MTRVALIDHGAGNLRSVQKALEAVGADVNLTSSTEEILNAEKVVLPGVGAFGDVMDSVTGKNLLPALDEIVRADIPLLGICVGMQILFEFSEEFGRCEGLGILRGSVVKFEGTELKVPHTGWNVVRPSRDSPLLAGLPDDSYAYFNHSFYCSPDAYEDVFAETDYGNTYASVVGKKQVFGVQFHPEKSQNVGLRILRNFLENV